MRGSHLGLLRAEALLFQVRQNHVACFYETIIMWASRGVRQRASSILEPNPTSSGSGSAPGPGRDIGACRSGRRSDYSSSMEYIRALIGPHWWVASMRTFMFMPATPCSPPASPWSDAAVLARPPTRAIMPRSPRPPPRAGARDLLSPGCFGHLDRRQHRHLHERQLHRHCHRQHPSRLVPVSITNTPGTVIYTGSTTHTQNTASSGGGSGDATGAGLAVAVTAVSWASISAPDTPG